MRSFLYTVTTKKSFETAVDAVEAKTVEKGFHVVHTYDVAATLAAAGLSRSPLKIIEVCNARFADEALKRDVNVALMLPCPIKVTALYVVWRPLDNPYPGPLLQSQPFSTSRETVTEVIDEEMPLAQNSKACTGGI